MSRFLIDRGIFEKSFWADVPAFRLFFLLIGKAAFKDGVMAGPVALKRGQWLRSYRNLQEDLAYVDEGGQKLYGMWTIKRCVEDLEQQGRIKTEATSYGTLFTLVNYEQYQEFSDFIKPQTERRQNADRTIRTNATNAINNPPTPQGGVCRFDEFWTVYPKKVAKAAVKRSWDRHMLNKHVDSIVDAVTRYKTTETWTKDNGKFVPNPLTFINQRRWEDEIPPVVGQTARQTRAEAMLIAWNTGKCFRLKSSGAVVSADGVEPFNHLSQKVTTENPTAFRSKRTGEHAFFTEFEIVEE